MNITPGQIEQAEAGTPVPIRVPGRGTLYLVDVGFYEKLTTASRQSDTELDAFLELAAREADEIASENPY